MEDIKKKTGLTEEQQEQVSGGRFGVRKLAYHNNVVERDSKGRPTHWASAAGDTSVYHYVCPHCKKLLHEGDFGRLYCDPCDEGWFLFSLPSDCTRYGRFRG